MTAHHPAALPKGHRIGEYEIVRVLGAGGFGVTYLAFDHQLDGPVALKEYFPAEAARRGPGWGVAPSTTGRRAVFTWGLDRFIDEARSLHRLRHPNVVRAHRYVQAHGTAYIVMEYVEGESLQQVILERGRLTPDAWRRWLDPLLDGLAHVHGHGYLHRDVKPANIMIRAADGTPVLIDFGAARVAARDRTHTQVLTPGYAPLEQYSREGTQGPPTDIYALASVSYRVLTGERLSSAPDRVLDDDYEPLANRIQGADRRWLTAIDHGLALRPEDRPQTVPAWTAVMRGARSAPVPDVDAETRASRNAGRATVPQRADSPAPSRASLSLRHSWWIAAILLALVAITSDPPDRSPASISGRNDPSADRPQRLGASAPPTRSTARTPTGRSSNLPDRSSASVSGGNDRSAGPPQRPDASEHPTDRPTDFLAAGRWGWDAQTRATAQAPTSRSTPRSPPVSSPEAGEARLELDRSARRVIQRGLRADGFDPGSVDGLFGPATRASLRAWQRSRGQAATGYLDGQQATELWVSAGQRQQRSSASTPANPRPVRPFVDALSGSWSSIDRAGSDRGNSDLPNRSPANASGGNDRNTERPQRSSASERPNRPAAQAPTGSSTAYFARGSLADDVLRLQGTPTSINRYPTLGHETWRYGSSSVTLSTGSRQVIEWANHDGNLKVRLAPGRNGTNATSYTRGSHQDDVLRLQGTPTSINRYPSLGHETWRYGSSSVTLSTGSRQVIEWANHDGNLKVRLAPGRNGTNATSYTRGSHQDDVLRLQGTPTSINRYPSLGHETWRYGSSSVTLSTGSRQVIEWANHDGNLKVRLTPGRNGTNATSYTRGSHQDDVLRLQGTPTSINRYPSLGHETWRYGSSSVTLSTGSRQVIEWANHGGNLRVRQAPAGR